MGPPTDFSQQAYQLLIKKYLSLSQQNDRLVKLIRAGTQVDFDYLRQTIQTDFPLYVRLQDYFSRLRNGGLRPVDQPPSISGGPVFEGTGEPPCSVDAGMEGDSEMRLASDPDVMSMFFGTTASASIGKSPTNSDRGPFGVRFSDFPPRVISQMLSTQSDVAASSCACSRNLLGTHAHRSSLASWRGLFKWAGFEPASRAKKFMMVPMIGMSATNGKDLYVKDNPHTHPNHLFLQACTYMATEHDSPPIGNEAGERRCLRRVD